MSLGFNAPHIQVTFIRSFVRPFPITVPLVVVTYHTPSVTSTLQSHSILSVHYHKETQTNLTIYTFSFFFFFFTSSAIIYGLFRALLLFSYSFAYSPPRYHFSLNVLSLSSYNSPQQQQNYIPVYPNGGAPFSQSRANAIASC